MFCHVIQNKSLPGNRILWQYILYVPILPCTSTVIHPDLACIASCGIAITNQGLVTCSPNTSSHVQDLKSPNVLLTEEGVAKIADVGMLRTQERDLVTAQATMTPLWSAPEVIARQPASVKCDMWSYGLLVWELATGLDIAEYQPLALTTDVPVSDHDSVHSLIIAFQSLERCLMASLEAAAFI